MQCAPAGIPLVINLSVIPVGAVSALLDEAAASRVVGAHFWNPPDVIPRVGAVQRRRSSSECVKATIDLLRAAGCEQVHVRRDTVPGNRMQQPARMCMRAEGECVRSGRP